MLSAADQRYLVISGLTEKKHEQVLQHLRMLEKRQALPVEVLWSEALLAVLFYAQRVTVEVLREFGNHDVFPGDRCWRIAMAWLGNKVAIESALADCGIVKTDANPLPTVFDKYAPRCVCLPGYKLEELLEHMVAPDQRFSSELSMWLREKSENFHDALALQKRVRAHNTHVDWLLARAAGYDNEPEDFMNTRD